MSPTSSARPLTDSASKNRSRNNSFQDPSKSATPSSRPGSPNFPVQTPTQNSPHYTVFIRLPFKREQFQDPPPVNWDATKDRKLWKLISSGKGELNWEGLSQDFGVELGFLLMQAAWLNERHVERIRKQVGRISGGGGGDATASGLGTRNFPLSTGGNETSSPGTSTPQPSRINISRTPSTATVTQSKLTTSTAGRRRGSGRRPHPIMTSNQSPKETPLEDSESSEEEPRSAISRSQAFRRPPITSRSKVKQQSTLGTLGSDGDEEDEDEDSGGGYLPFATNSAGKDPAATLRGSPKRAAFASQPSQAPKPIRQDTGGTTTTTTTTTESSASSATFSPPPRTTQPPSSSRPQTALSPRQRAALHSADDSHSPSMGSSFSDLDVDASITQSALEEALMSNMRAQGGSTMTMGSRMSSLRDALSSGRRNQQGQQGGQR